MRRSAAVADQFYHGTPEKLTQQVSQYVFDTPVKEHAIAILSPHAGLIYSGAVAGEVYSRIEMPQTFILLGPNHTGIGPDISLMSAGDWEIPTGLFEIDEKLANKIAVHAPEAVKDIKAHTFEHSLEVQLPFIAYFSVKPKIVPIIIRSISMEQCKILGNAIAQAVRDTKTISVIVASTDMSHYVSDDTARHRDRKAVSMIEALDPEGLYKIVVKEKISMCGVLPSVVMLFAANALGAIEAKLVKYATSAEVSGDFDYVVGYAGMIVK